MKTKRKATKVKAAVKRPKNVAKAATGSCFCMPALEVLITGSTMCGRDRQSRLDKPVFRKYEKIYVNARMMYAARAVSGRVVRLLGMRRVCYWR
jgi:hypothetical protein